MRTSVKNLQLLTVVIAIAGLCGAAQATLITGTYGPAPASVDLTTANVGWVRDSGSDSQTSGGTGLSLFSQLLWSGTSEDQYNFASTTFTPAGLGANAGSRYQVTTGTATSQPLGTGYSITVTNSTSLPQTLSVYTGIYASDVALTAGDFSGTASAAGNNFGVWTINIPANYGPFTVNYTVSANLGPYSNNSVFGASLIAVPEPSSIVLLGMGGVGLLAAVRRRRK